MIFLRRTGAYFKRLYIAARNKVTTYVALAIAGLAQLAANAENLLNSIPGLKSFLPAGPILASYITKYIIPGLGFLVVWTRVRRMLKDKS